MSATRRTPRPAPVYDPERTARVITAMRAEVERIGGSVRTSPGYVHFHIPDIVRLDVCVTLIGTDDLLRIVLQQLADVVRVGRDAARPAVIPGVIG